MCVSHPAALLLVFAVTSIQVGAVEFPVLFRNILGCIKDQCSEMIDDCQQRHGEALTEQLRGCVAEGCTKKIFDCTDWFIDGLMNPDSTGTVSSPLSFGEKYRQDIENVASGIQKGFSHCFQREDYWDRLECSECLLEMALSLTEQDSKVFSVILGISEPAVCWLKSALKLGFNCFYNVDENYFTLVDDNLNKYQSIYQKEYTRCSVNIFKDKKCFQMFSQIFGSTPEILVQSKGLFICMINALVLATTAC
ncbi:uncharacterized protein [Hoplias malabaricus]|uniref:uncharacterized protein n=1 Tax=Hoplias malabaricus TaxID=27720 RepID=UPI003462B860